MPSPRSRVTSSLRAGLAVWLAAAALSAQTAEVHSRVAAKLRDLFNASDWKGVEALFDREMAKALPLEKTREVLGGIRTQLGKIEDLGDPALTPPLAVFPARFEHGKLDIQIALDAEGLISGLFFKPPSADRRPPPDRNRTALALPFRGRWSVLWGGDTKEVNYHHDTPNQRFALDVLGADEEGRTRRGKGERNEDYLAFGKEVLAPADGLVIEAIEGVRDNVPGSMNPYSALGNCVVIQHRPDEVSVLAHLKKGSVRVKAGEKVKGGQVIGLCGNSGNSSEPHIHFHLQHTPVLQDGRGIKCLFARVKVVRDGKTEERKEYAPVKGDIISPP